MKKIISVLLVATAAMVSCSKMQVEEPRNEVSNEDLIKVIAAYQTIIDREVCDEEWDVIVETEEWGVIMTILGTPYDETLPEFWAKIGW